MNSKSHFVRLSRKNLRRAAFGLLAVLCGCSSGPMIKTQYRSEANESKALITFVRDAMWMGDAINFTLWDGETFVGTMAAGTMVQYEATPGPHVFMCRSESWSYVKADVLQGKHYFIKVNVFPGFATARSFMKPVETSDKRIQSWPKSSRPMAVDVAKAEKYVPNHVEAVQAALKAFNDGAVTFDVVNDKHAF